MKFRLKPPSHSFREAVKFVIVSAVLTFFYICMPSKPNEHKNKDLTNVHLESNTVIDVETESKFIKTFEQGRDPHGKHILKKIDWHNYNLIKEESQREGIGEHGIAASLPDQDASELYRLLKKYGYNTALGDKISLNRSLPDIRHSGCRKRLYIETLPSVSVIIIFHNEHWTTLLRTVFSVMNRSPEKLIKEIFLVDDASEIDFLKENLDDYVKKNLPKVKVVRLRSRAGIVGARLAGAKLATADVLVFLDSHMEVNVNWLPPLLEPIAVDYRTTVEPIIDDIDALTFTYKTASEGFRGGFDFIKFVYVSLPMLPKDTDNLPEPFENPVMNGGAFAISWRFFWELGGYDPGIKIWGCEQFEISFKIWQCGGRLLEAPCSHIGHLYRKVCHPVPFNGSTDYFYKNLRRVADVWMDEYAKLRYKSLPEYTHFDPGDLTEQKALRQRLKCKPFKWFMTQVAFDLLQQYPIEEPLPYAEGRIRPKFRPDLCIDAFNGQHGDPVRIKKCERSLDDSIQDFVFSWKNDIQVRKWSGGQPICIDVVNSTRGAHVKMLECHGYGGNQQWKYYENAKRLECVYGFCLDYNPENLELFLWACNNQSKTQQWTIDLVRSDQLKKWSPLNTQQVIEPAERWDED